MQEVLMDKVVVNMSVGSDPDEMKKAVQIIKLVTGKKPVNTLCQSKIPDWGLRPGIPIGLKVTLRGNDAIEFLKKAIQAKAGKISSKSFDKEGNFGFGVGEYIDLPGAKYDPKLGIKGFDVLVALRKKGFRVKKRRIMPTKVGINQRVKKEEAIKFAESLGIKVE
ncbi:MAG: 50S ribosomal protein L5 [Candidatus Iainarchaeum sp.]|jgi:large subunit ribosomal protein L5|nr:MAG: 50S ribosomal protein L5 [archaeon ADurb.Bin336]